MTDSAAHSFDSSLWPTRDWQTVLRQSAVKVVPRDGWDFDPAIGARWINPHETLSSFKDDDGLVYEQPIIRPKDAVKTICIHHTLRAEDVYGTDHKAPLPETRVLQRILELHVTGEVRGEDRRRPDGSKLVGQKRTDISYGLLIGKSGIVYEGRHGGPYVQQAGAYGINSDGIHIAVIGDYESHGVSTPQKVALRKVLIGLCKEFDLDPMALYSPPNLPLHERIPTISGHRDAVLRSSEPAAAICPGEQLYRILPELRLGVAQGLEQPLSI